MKVRYSRGNSEVGFLLLFVAIIGLGAYMKFFGKGRTLSSHAPIGALEYFESTDRTTKLILFKDRIYFESPGIVGVPGPKKNMDMLISEVVGVRRSGTQVAIVSKDQSQINIDLGAFDADAAQRFKDKVEQLKRQPQQDSQQPPPNNQMPPNRQSQPNVQPQPNSGMKKF